MLKICFVCLGNICRSPMAEYIMKDKVQKLGLSSTFLITSKATSYEEAGNDLYPPAKAILQQNGINCPKHQSTRLEKSDYSKYDYFIAMEQANIDSMLHIFGGDPLHKISLLLDRNIKDPWYYHNFTETYADISTGIDQLISQVTKK